MPRPKVNVTIDDLTPYFHLPIKSASIKLGICTTVLKRVCRESGIKRWPHRKIKSIDKKIVSRLVQMCLPSEDELTETVNQLVVLQKRKQETLSGCADKKTEGTTSPILGSPDNKMKVKRFSHDNFSQNSNMTSTLGSGSSCNVTNTAVQENQIYSELGYFKFLQMAPNAEATHHLQSTILPPFLNQHMQQTAEMFSQRDGNYIAHLYGDNGSSFNNNNNNNNNNNTSSSQVIINCKTKQQEHIVPKMSINFLVQSS